MKKVYIIAGIMLALAVSLFVVAQEDLRNKNLQQRMEAEIKVAQFQFKLADLELEVIVLR